MKNVNGLREAMAVVESACENGEITIIGHGAMPSAPEMLVKCAEFLVNKMGADVDLIAVVNDALVRYNNGEGKSCSCGCPACCEGEDAEDDLDEEVVEVGKFDTDGIREYLAEALYDMLPCVDEDIVDEIAEEIVGYYANDLDGSPSEDLNTEAIIHEIAEIIADKVSGFKWSVAEEVAVDIEEHIANCLYEAVEE